MGKRVCVVGAGRWGAEHIRTLNQLGVLGGVVEVRRERLEQCAEKYPGVRLFHSLQDAVREDFDGFTIATPVLTHFEFARFILQRGKHVLVEKPMALTVKEAEELVELARRGKVNLMVGHTLLFHPAIQKIKEVIASGKIGRLQYLYSNRLNLGTVRTEENALWNFAPHDLAVFQYFIGALPIQVTARGGIFLQPGIHDTTVTILTYPNHIVGHIFVSWLHPFKEHRLVMIGSKGMLSFEDSSEEKNICFYEKGIDWFGGLPVSRDGSTEMIPYEKAEPLEKEMEYFVRHLSGKTLELADGKSGIEVLNILEEATAQLDLEIFGRAQTRVSPLDAKSYFVHETAVVEQPSEIGAGTKIWHFSHVMKGAKIGAGCTFGQNTHVARGAIVGNRVKVQNNVSIYSGVILEDDVFLGPSCVFTNVKYPRSEIDQHSTFERTLIRQGATIGANATLLCGIQIGRYAFVAAGAVVTQDVPDYALVTGIPARRVGWVSHLGLTLAEPDPEGVMICPESGRRYKEILPGVLRCLDEHVAFPVPVEGNR